MAKETGELLNAIKTIIDNYMKNRKPAAVVLGTYNGTAMVVNERLPVPMELISGNMKSRLATGDKVRLLRNDGGYEYYILEIIGRPYQVGG
ncbi:MAG: DNA helicase [Hungatella sp.]